MRVGSDVEKNGVEGGDRSRCQPTCREAVQTSNTGLTPHVEVARAVLDVANLFVLVKVLAVKQTISCCSTIRQDCTHVKKPLSFCS